MNHAGAPQGPPCVRAHEGGVRITVRVTPRASKPGIEGIRDGALRIRLAAPPVEGAANEELIRILAKALRVPRGAVQVAGGHRSRTKLVDIAGATEQQVRDIT